MLAFSSVLICLGCTRISFLRFLKFFQNQIVFRNYMFRGTNKFHWILTDRDKCKCTIKSCNVHIEIYFQDYNGHYNQFLFYIMTFHAARKVCNISLFLPKTEDADCSSLISQPTLSCFLHWARDSIFKSNYLWRSSSIVRYSRAWHRVHEQFHFLPSFYPDSFVLQRLSHPVSVALTVATVTTSH